MSIINTGLVLARSLDVASPVTGPGSTIAHYEIIRSLGRGGMAEVYLARDTRLHRNVALKIVDGGAVASQRTSVLREARLASAVSHPNIAHIYEAGEQDGQGYIAMEYVDGKTLTTLVHEKRLAYPDTIEIAFQVAQALSAAHHASVIHRDLKPSNIVVSNRGVVKVLDFGLAKATLPDHSIESLSAGGGLIGTVTHMSPEQAMGEDLDARSDIFSFGVVLYEMVTGHPPFSGATAAQVLMKILNDTPAPIREAARDAPPALQQVINRCLEKRPENRYASAEELVADLKTISIDVSARLASGRYLLRRHRRGLLWFVAVLAFAATGIAVGMRWARGLRGPSASTIATLAIMPFSSTPSGDRTDFIGDGLTETLINRLSRVPHLRVVSRPTVFAYKGKSFTPQQVGRDLNVRGLLTGRVIVEGNAVEVQAELIDAANDQEMWGNRYRGSVGGLVQIQNQIAADVTRELDVPLNGSPQATVTPMTHDPEAYQLYLRGRYLLNQGGYTPVTKSIGYFRESLKRDPRFALAHAALAAAWIRVVVTRGISAGAGYDNALPEAREAARLDPNSAEVEAILGDIAAYHQWDFAAADRHFRRAVELDPNSVNAHSIYALYLVNRGRTDDGLREARIAQSLDPSPAYIITGVRALYYGRRYQEAESEARKAVYLDPKGWSSWDFLAEVLYAEGRIAEWYQAFRQYQINKSRPELAPILDEAWRKGGERGVWAAMLQDSEKKEAAGDQPNLHDWAIAAVRAGNYDRAFQLLEKLYEERAGEMVRFRVSPVWDPIRGDPRYWALVKRMGLPEPQVSDRTVHAVPAEVAIREAIQQSATSPRQVAPSGH